MTMQYKNREKETIVLNSDDITDLGCVGQLTPVLGRDIFMSSSSWRCMMQVELCRASEKMVAGRLLHIVLFGPIMLKAIPKQGQKCQNIGLLSHENAEKCSKCKRLKLSSETSRG